jgi:hypothetical protein
VAHVADGAHEAGATATSTSLVAVPRVERALVALAVQTQRLDQRLDELTRAVAECRDATLDLPTHEDVLEVRLHSARVAAELARVTVELQSEIDKRTTPTPRERRLQNLAEVIIDLSDALDTQRIDTQPTDTQPTDLRSTA